MAQGSPRMGVTQHPQPDITLQQAQSRFYAFCEARGWNGANGAELVMLLTEEVGEISKEVRYLHFNKAPDRQETLNNLGDELVDAFNYICRLANMYEIDLTAAYE